MPADFGFEGWSAKGYGHPYNSEEYAAYVEELGMPTASVSVGHHMNNPEFEEAGVLLKNENCMRLMQSTGVLETPVETHEAYFINHMANRWIEEAAAGEDPFCVRVDVWGPHQPYWVAEPHRDTVDPRAIPEYPNYACDLEGRPQFHRDFRDRVSGWKGQPKSWKEWQPLVARAYEHATQVDAAFARILDTLDQLGIADNTIVLYTADHGDAIASNGGVYDKSAFMTEETMRIPAAIRWPGRVPAGVVSENLVTNMDFVPTVLAAAGAKIPTGTDGRSFLDMAQDPAYAPWRDDLMCEHHGHGQHNFQRMLRWGSLKYVAHLGDIEELYDLAEDPYELNNRAGDPGMKATLAEMRERLFAWMDESDDNAPDAEGLRKQIGKAQQ